MATAICVLCGEARTITQDEDEARTVAPCLCGNGTYRRGD